jgi:hypothetical protein
VAHMIESICRWPRTSCRSAGGSASASTRSVWRAAAAGVPGACPVPARLDWSERQPTPSVAVATARPCAR